MESNNKFTVIFIKPDAVKDGLVDQIVEDFMEAGLTPVFTKSIELTLDQAMMIYRDHVGNPNYEFAVKSLVQEDECKTTVFLLLKSNGGDALTLAQEIKGRADINGIRAKYRRYSWTDLKEKGIEGDKLMAMLSRNRVHVPDSDDHVREIIGVLLNETELREIIEDDPELIEFIEGSKNGGDECEGIHGDKERL